MNPPPAPNSMLKGLRLQRTIAMEVERLSNIELGGPGEGSAEIPRIADMM